MTSPTDSYLDDYDPHFNVFHELMGRRVREILLVSSPYDAYIMEEDGSMASRIINEYHGLNLSRPPRLTRVTTARQALDLLDRKRFDLVITMPRLGGMGSELFGREVKKRHPGVPVILLAHSVRETLLSPDTSHGSAIDSSYVWCCDSEIMLAIVKSVEDRLNVDADTRRAMVRVILLVEDSAVHRSRILPLLYGEVVRQTQMVLDEGLNEKHRLLKMRARPKILLAASHEEARKIFARYRPYIYCVMSDVRYPKNGRLTDDAGLQLLRRFREKQPDLPLLLLSTDPANRKPAEAIPAVFVDKGDPEIRDRIHDFFLRYLGFGDFVFRMPDGSEVGRAANLHAFERRLREVPAESILYHARHNHFSNWVMARAEIGLAARLHRRFYRTVHDGERLREDLVFKVHALRRLRQQGIVVRFDRRDYDPEVMELVRIGQGSMGGKARGLAFFATRLHRSRGPDSVLSSQSVRIPRTCVVAADGFDDFVRENQLHYRSGESDQEIAARFLAARLPAWLERDLRAFLARIRAPLSVRSSSLLEDAQFRPYAGLYATYMLINQARDFETRFDHLVRAVKLVYASTWYADPRAFSRSIGQERQDSMAVIIQELVGHRHGRYFYPSLSGVIQSWNYYPVDPMTARDGIAHVALGFGRTVVEGERCLRFSPVHPRHLVQFSTVDDILENSQRYLYALDCSDPGRFSPRGDNLVRVGLDEVSDDPALRALCSTYIPEEHRIRDADLPGPRLATLAPVLKYDRYPLAALLRELIDMGREGMGCEVEMEFSVDLRPEPEPSDFFFLQIRPIVAGEDLARVRIGEEERKTALLRSTRALGHGCFEGWQDLLLVRPETFDAARTREIAGEIGRLNSRLRREKRPYLLIGPGRWGSADPWLGIPVRWGDIAGVGGIVELQDAGIRADPSQGAHFFQNITSLNIPYLMIHQEKESGEWLDGDFLSRLEVVEELEHVSLLRAERALVLKVDGHTGEAVLLAGKN